MSATPTTPATPASTATTRIEHPTTLTLLRFAWTALLILQLVSVAYLIQVNLSGMAVMPEFRSGNRVPGVVISTLGAMASLVISILLMWRSKNARAALLFSFVFLAIVPFGYTLHIPEAVPAVVARSRELFSSLALMTIIFLFPDVQFVSPLSRWVFFGLSGAVVGGYLLGVPGFASGAFFLAWIIGPIFFIIRYRHAASLQRQQIKWLFFPIVGGVLLIFTWAFASFLLPDDIYPRAANLLGIVAQLLILLIPVTIGLAVLRYGLWQVDFVINRTVVYSGLVLVLAIVTMLFIALTAAVLGNQNAPVGLAFGAGAALGLFNPLRLRLQHIVDHRIYRLRYDLNEVAAAQQPPEIKNPGAFTGKRFGSYEALGVLGRGGMGEVYKGTGNGETVAIKLLAPELAQQEEFQKRFEREARTLAALDHPNIVKLKTSGSSDGVLFLAMEYIDGQELSSHTKQPVTDYAVLRDWLRDIGTALDYIHAQGLVHRDLKASNIMLRPRSDKERLEAVVMDFGIARTDASGTRLTGTGAVGTIDYMAPEQIMAARDVDKRADIYALGVIVYELLTGERPFKGSAGQVLFAHLQQPAPDPRDVKSDIPRELAKAVIQALAKNPDERFQSAGEFAATFGG